MQAVTMIMKAYNCVFILWGVCLESVLSMSYHIKNPFCEHIKYNLRNAGGYTTPAICIKIIFYCKENIYA